MTQREKLLAAAVGVLALLIVSFYAINRISDAFATRDDRLMNLESEVTKKRRTITFGRAAQRQLDDYLQRSLPADRHLASSLYQNWLVAKADQAEITGVKVSPNTSRMHGELYYQHSFVISGFGEWPQLVRFLHEFYSVDYLHRISHLSTHPSGKTKQLDIRITVDALSLKKAEQRKLEPRAADRLAYKEVEPYLEAIAHRNFFRAANKPPLFDAPRTEQGNPKRLVSVQFRGNDPDGDELSYSLGDGAPEGAQINSRSGDFSWTPSELGDFKFDICVKDDGLPPQSVTKTFTVSVVQAPPETVGFDPATLAKVTGITETDGYRVVWVTVPTEGKSLRLKKGDRLAVGTMQGVVQEIRLRPKEAQFATDDGRVIIVGLGKTLVPNAASPISGL